MKSSTIANLMFGVAALAHVPLGFEYVRRMWSHGHYQFVPLLIAVALWMVYDRLSKSKEDAEPPTLTVLAVCLLVNIGLLSAAVLFHSNFAAIVSFIMLVATYMYYRGGKAGLRASLPAWLLLVFAIPLPDQFDQKLVLRLQFLASQLASWILDSVGQIHFRQGVVLITEQSQFFAEEACSGIRSLFSSLAAIAIYGVINKYPWSRHLFNLLQTFVWVLVGNALRIAMVVYVADNWTDAVASGTTHEMLGLGVFLFIIGMAICTDRAFSVVWRKRAIEAEDEQVEEPVLQGKVMDKDQVPTAATGSKTALFAVCTLLFVCLALFSARLTYAKNSGEIRIGFTRDSIVASVESDLPSSIVEWEVTDFTDQFRGEDAIFTESQTWTLKKNDLTATLSVDSPYSQFKGLQRCYTAIGWDAVAKHEYQGDGEDLSGFTTVDMTKPGEYGIVLFSAFDRDGKLVPPESELNRRTSDVEKNLQFVLGINKESGGVRLPISQIQLLVESGREFTDVQKDDLKNLFTTARDILLKTSRFRPDGQ